MDIESIINKYKLNNKKELKTTLKLINDKNAFLFAMSGKMAAGKDTIGDIISDKLIKINNLNIKSVSFGYLIRREVDEIVENYKKTVDKNKYSKSINSTIENLDKLSYIIKNYSAFDRTEESRSALQFWGTEIRRKQNSDYWINQMSKYIVENINLGYTINITDARFPNEVQLVEDMSGKIIRLDVPEDVQIKRIKERDNIDVGTEVLHHVSETALDDYQFDKVFDGTELPDILGESCYNYIVNE